MKDCSHGPCHSLLPFLVRSVKAQGFVQMKSRYFWSSGHPFIIREPVFISAGKGTSEEFLSEFQNSSPNDESEDTVSQPHSPNRLWGKNCRDKWWDLLHIIDDWSHSLLVIPKSSC